MHLARQEEKALVTGADSGVATLVVAAVALYDRAGRVLAVRKRGTQRFMLPGGKLEAGESAVDAAVREIAEELGVSLVAGELTDLGQWTADAANEPGHLVCAAVFGSGRRLDDARPQAEIDACRWVDPTAAPAPDLAPLLVDLLPVLRPGAGPAAGISAPGRR